MLLESRHTLIIIKIVWKAAEFPYRSSLPEKVPYISELKKWFKITGLIAAARIGIHRCVSQELKKTI